MKKIALAAFLGLALISTAYAEDAYHQAPAASVRLKSNQQMVDVTLAANPTTGYQWFVKRYDHDLLSLQNYRYIPAPANAKVGAGGVAVFSFAVDPRFYDAPQATNIVLVYEQPWNPGKNATTVKVAVSAVASSNDYSDWQKYPQLAGPAAEVQAGEAGIKTQDQASLATAVIPAVMVPLPVTAAPASAPAKAAASTSSTAATANVKNAAPAASTASGSSAAATNNNAQGAAWLSLPEQVAPVSAKATPSVSVSAAN